MSIEGQGKDTSDANLGFEVNRFGDSTRDYEDINRANTTAEDLVIPELEASSTPLAAPARDTNLRQKMWDIADSLDNSRDLPPRREIA